MCVTNIWQIRTTNIQPSFDPARVFNFGDPIYCTTSHFCCLEKISAHFLSGVEIQQISLVNLSLRFCVHFAWTKCTKNWIPMIFQVLNYTSFVIVAFLTGKWRNNSSEFEIQTNWKNCHTVHFVWSVKSYTVRMRNAHLKSTLKLHIEECLFWRNQMECAATVECFRTNG